MGRSPGREFVNLIENVPRWPAGGRIAPAPSWDDIYNYAPCAGAPDLALRVAHREEGLHGVPVKTANVLVTHGGLYALSLIFRSLSGDVRGATALCQAPVLGAIPQ